MFISFLFIRFYGTASARERLSFHKSFGFHKNGFFNVTLSEPNITRIMVGFMNETEMDNFNQSVVSVTDYCNDTLISYSQKFSVLNFQNLDKKEKLSYYGNIEEKGVHYLYYYGCPEPYYRFKFSLVFQNPNSGLDSRSEPLLYTTPVILVLDTVLLVIWLLNWFCNFKVQIYIHYMFTATFTFTCLNVLAEFIDIITTKNDGNTTASFIFSFITLIIKYILLLATLMLCAKGWCIIADTIQVKELFLSFIYSGITIGSIFILYYGESLNQIFIIILLIVSVISLLLYFQKLMKSLSDVNLQIFAHMLAIKNAGIDPNTTPLKKKKDMYTKFYYCFILFCIFVAIQLTLSLFSSTTYWIQPFVWQLTDTILFIILGYIFRIRDVDNGGYYEINETNPDTVV